MANNLLTPDVIAEAALATLYETTVMAGLVHRDYEDTFANAVGDTITIRKPATFVALEYNRAAGITVQDANESGIPMTLNHFADVSFAVTSEDQTLKITDFSERLLSPAMEAISQKVDRDLLALRTDITQQVGTTAGEEWDDPRVLIAAGRKLTQKSVPLTGRSVVVGPTMAGEWLKDDLMNRADARGDTLGLQEASLGRRVFNFDPYETNNIVQPNPGVGVSTTEVGLAFHRTAFAMAVRPLALPRGAANAAIANYKGFGLRVIFGYDMDKKQDICSIDILYGCKTLDPNRAVIIRGALGV
jgi:hypothetical protein